MHWVPTGLVLLAAFFVAIEQQWTLALSLLAIATMGAFWNRRYSRRVRERAGPT